MSRTVLRASFRSRAIALIFRFCTKYARRTLAIVSTVTIPLLTPGANHALGAGLPPGGWGQNCTPLHISQAMRRPRARIHAQREALGRLEIRLQKKARKWDKPPINPHTGEYAKVNNPDSWGTFDQALAAMHKYGLVG